MKELFLPYELAVIAKEKGFDEPCLTTYMPNPLPPYKWYLQSINSILVNPKEEQTDSHKLGFTGYRNSIPAHFGLKSIAAPLYQQIIDWLRDKHDIRFKIEPIDCGGTVDIFMWHILGWKFIGQFESDNEALNKAIEEAFKLIK